MKRSAMFATCAAFGMVLPGCLSIDIRTNTRAPSVSEEAVPMLHIKQSVAFRNAAPSSGEVLIGEWSNMRVYADLHKYTESAIGAATNVLKRQNISVDDDADKILELSVFGAKTEEGMWTFRSTTEMRVRTGDGLVKEFEASRKYANAYSTTAFMERTLARAVADMFSDPEILEYLEN